jgi:hypothetical protein
MPAHLLEGYFQLPVHHKPGEDLLRIGIEVGTQEGLGEDRSHQQQLGMAPNALGEKWRERRQKPYHPSG